MKIIFCSDPLTPKTVDSEYKSEFDAAVHTGFETDLVNFEELSAGNLERATRRIPMHDHPQLAVYRGWMMRPQIYSNLYETLLAKNIKLINDPAAYRHCHFFPESYAVIKDWTPQTVWLNTTGHPDFDQIMQLLKVFGGRPIIVKDYVKSQKHSWADACFIPSADSRRDVEWVVGKFLELQSEDLNEGLVFREYVELAPLTKHSKSGMPLTKEFRIFFCYGKPLEVLPYWDEGDYGFERPELADFLGLGKQVKSNFFTMDVAKTADSRWIVIELGDGQVAGLPDNCDIEEFYAHLANQMKRHDDA